MGAGSDHARLWGSTLRPTSATCSTGSARIRRGGSRNCCPIAGRRYATPARPRRTDRLPSPGFFAVTTEEFGAFRAAPRPASAKNPSARQLVRQGGGVAAPLAGQGRPGWPMAAHQLASAYKKTRVPRPLSRAHKSP